MTDDVLIKLGSIEAKLDVALAAQIDHSKRIGRLETRNTYQTGFMAGLAGVSAVLGRLLLSHR